MCSEFKCQTAGFPGAKLLDHLVCVNARVTVRMQEPKSAPDACRSGSPERVSTLIVDVDTKTVTTAKTGARLRIACLPVHNLVTSVLPWLQRSVLKYLV